MEHTVELVARHGEHHRHPLRVEFSTSSPAETTNPRPITCTGCDTLQLEYARLYIGGSIALPFCSVCRQPLEQVFRRLVAQ